MDSQEIAIVGATFSALIAALAYYGKARHERLRTTRTVLYYLLEMRYHIAVAQYGIANFTEQYKEKVKAVLVANNVVISETELEPIAPLLRRCFNEMLTEQVGTLETQMVEPYLRALTDLSRDDPLLAYRLKGREALARASKEIAKFAKTINVPEIPPSGADIKEAFFADLDDIDRETTLNLLDMAIRQVAARCGPVVYLRTRHALKVQGNAALPAGLDEKMDALLGKFLKVAVEHDAKHLAKTTL